MGIQKLSFNEQRVLDVLKGKTFVKGKTFEPKDKLTLADIAQRGFRHVRPFERANSWVRNALRALVKLKLVKKVDRGTYAATVEPKRVQRVARAVEPAAAEAAQ